MIDNLNEINRLLLVASKLGGSTKGALESSVIKLCREFVLRGTFPDHQGTIDFCVEAGIVQRRANRIRLTNIGERLLSLNPEREYELNSRQKEFFAENCLLTGILGSKAKEVLAQFSPAYSVGTYQWSPADNAPISGDAGLIDLMRQSGLLKNVGGIESVEKPFVPLVSSLLRPPLFFTPEQLALRIKAADEIGKIAEAIAVDFERNRLKDAGFPMESECIQSVSELNIAAGYDIQSFDGSSPNIVHDRFIEVKGSTGDRVEFFWSRNEMRKAKSLRRRYWIYFVRGINKENRTSNSEPTMIQDPYVSVLKNKDFTIECELTVVKEKH